MSFSVKLRVNCFFFFFNDTATTEIYTLSLHDALPICRLRGRLRSACASARARGAPRPSTGPRRRGAWRAVHARSEEHTSELQSPCNLVCRLLLEKKTIKFMHDATHYTLLPSITTTART